MNVPFSQNGSVPHRNPTPEAKNVSAIVISFIAIPLMLLIVIPTAWMIAKMTGKPAFNTMTEVRIDDIARLEIRLFNLKESVQRDRKEDDLGPYIAKPEHYERLLAPLIRSQASVDLPPKMYLGEYRIQLKDGRQQSVRLSFVDRGPNTPRELVFKIGTNAYIGGPVHELVNIVEACDPRPK